LNFFVNHEGLRYAMNPSLPSLPRRRKFHRPGET
jgi:hypothetical protein